MIGRRSGKMKPSLMAGVIIGVYLLITVAVIIFATIPTIRAWNECNNNNVAVWSDGHSSCHLDGGVTSGCRIDDNGEKVCWDGYIDTIDVSKSRLITSIAVPIVLLLVLVTGAVLIIRRRRNGHGQSSKTANGTALGADTAQVAQGNTGITGEANNQTKDQILDAFKKL